LRDYLNVAVPYIYFYEGGGKLYSQIGWGGHGQIGPPGSATEYGLIHTSTVHLSETDRGE